MNPVGLRAAALALALSGCAGLDERPTPLPATIGAAARMEQGRVVISEVGQAARIAGLSVGDVVISYNGITVRDVRHFERLVIDSAPGSLARVDVLRGGRPLVIDLRVREMDISPLA